MKETPASEESLETAVRACDEALALGPENVKALYRRAQSRLELDKLARRRENMGPLCVVKSGARRQMWGSRDLVVGRPASFFWQLSGMLLPEPVSTDFGYPATRDLRLAQGDPWWNPTRLGTGQNKLRLELQLVCGGMACNV